MFEACCKFQIPALNSVGGVGETKTVQSRIDKISSFFSQIINQLRGACIPDAFIKLGQIYDYHTKV